MDRSFEKEIIIDQYNLDKECAVNGEKVIYWGRKWAEAEARKERSKKILDEVRAELDIRIRKDPQGFGLEKVTEGAIGSLIPLQEEYKKTYDEYIDSLTLSRELGLVKDAFLQRKDLVLAEIKLYLAEYFHSEERLGFTGDKEIEVRRELNKKGIKLSEGDEKKREK